MISLAVATVALAVQSRAILEVHASEADYARIAAQIELDGAEALAMDALYGGGGLTRPRASVDIAGKAVEIVAEGEATKLSLTEASTLDGVALAALGAGDTQKVQRRLAELAASSDPSPGDIAQLDPSPRWMRCARSWISPYGMTSDVSPQSATSYAQAHVGEVWRLVARTADGWTEDRTLRVTGEDHAPARVIDSILFRSPPGDEPCRLAAALPSKTTARAATP